MEQNNDWFYLNSNNCYFHRHIYIIFNCIQNYLMYNWIIDLKSLENNDRVKDNLLA